MEPTPPEVNIRTMESDLKTAPAEVVQVPETANQLPPPGTVISEELKVPDRKKWLWTAAIVLGAVILGLIAYFVIYPLIFAPKVEAPIIEPEGTEAPLPIAKVHQSLFAKAPAAVRKINLFDVSLLNIAVALQDEAIRPLTPGLIKEIEILDDVDSQISFSAYLPEFLPSLSGDKLKAWLEDDFTAYLYYDENGVWPGYVAKINPAASINELKAGIRQLENGDVTVFYVTPPGIMGNFKDGKIGAYSTRYAVGTKSGAAFNYGYFNNYLIISTSYNGLKAAMPLLGL